MNKKIVFYLVAVVIAIVGVAVFFSGCVGILMGDSRKDIFLLMACGALTFLCVVPPLLFSRPKNEPDRKFGLREGFAIVAFSWFAASAAGAIPFFVVSGMQWYDAFFETASGFTTTGASLIDPTLRLRDGTTLPLGVESLSYGILFWRSLTHWLGGMGIVVLTIAILPLLHIGGQALYNAETTGVKSMDSKIAPRIASSAKILWLVYLILTVLQTIFLVLGGMTFFDAVCHSFSTIATGGFSTRQASIAAWNSPFIDYVITIFMFLAGCNFVLHIRCFTGKPLEYWKDEEFRFYFFMTAGATLIITLFLVFGKAFTDPIAHADFYHNPFDAFRAAAFQVVSIFTSTGFATADYCAWPATAGVILFILMFIGGCGGSTAGGMKCVRALLLRKQSISEIRRCIFPRLVPDIRLNGTRVETTAIQKALGFFALFCGFYLFFVLLTPLICPGMSFETAVSVSIACLSNIGPGFDQVGPQFTYSWMTSPAKLLLAFEMILGRLELYTLLVLFLPSFWKK